MHTYRSKLRQFIARVLSLIVIALTALLSLVTVFGMSPDSSMNDIERLYWGFGLLTFAIGAVKLIWYVTGFVLLPPPRRDKEADNGNV